MAKSTSHQNPFDDFDKKVGFNDKAGSEKPEREYRDFDTERDAELGKEQVRRALADSGTPLTLGSSLINVTRGELDMQIYTARQYPRDIEQFYRKAEMLMCETLETAKSCIYSLSRNEQDGGKKSIVGASIRCAEIAAGAFTNLRVASRIIGFNERFVIAQGAAHDLETNVAFCFEVPRRITNKYGKTFSDDMIQVTAGAAGSIAMRNAIIRAVTPGRIDTLLNKVRRVISEKDEPLSVRRDKMLGYFDSQNVSEERVLAYLGKKNVYEVDDDDFITLIGVVNFKTENPASTYDDVFPVVHGKERPAFGAKDE